MNKKEVRKLFKQSVFKRDDYTCQICGVKNFKNPDEFFDAHHITDRSEMPNGGYVKENGITLCKYSKSGSEFDSCHMMAENFHISGGKDWISGLHPDDLYNKIESSKELAIKISNGD